MSDGTTTRVTEVFVEQPLASPGSANESTITIAQQLERGGEDVTQMMAETLLPDEPRTFGEVVSTKGWWPCRAGVAVKVEAFSGIRAHLRGMVVFDP